MYTTLWKHKLARILLTGDNHDFPILCNRQATSISSTSGHQTNNLNLNGADQGPIIFYSLMAKLFQLFALSALILALSEASGRGRGGSGRTLVKKEALEEMVQKKPAQRKRKFVKDDLSMWGYFDAGVQAASTRREASRANCTAPVQAEPQAIELAVSPVVSSPDILVDLNSSSNDPAEHHSTYFDTWFETLLSQYDNQENLQDNLFPGSGYDFALGFYAPPVDLEISNFFSEGHDYF